MMVAGGESPRLAALDRNREEMKRLLHRFLPGKEHRLGVQRQLAVKNHAVAGIDQLDQLARAAVVWQAVAKQAAAGAQPFNVVGVDVTGHYRVVLDHQKLVALQGTAGQVGIGTGKLPGR